MEHPHHRRGRSAAYRQIGLHHVVFRSGFRKAVEDVAENHGIGNVAADGGLKGRVAAVVGRGRLGLGREGDGAVPGVDFYAAHWRVPRDPAQALRHLVRHAAPRALAFGVGRRAQVGHQFGADGIQGDLRHRLVVGLRQVVDPVHGHLPVEQGQKRCRGKNDDEAG